VPRTSFLSQRAELTRWLPTLLLAVGSVLTAVAGWYVAATEGAAVEAKFLTDASRTRSQIEARLNTYFDVARTGAALLSASNEINVVEFRAFVAGLQLRERYPGMRGIGFAEAVATRELSSFQRVVRLDGMSGFRVWPPGERPQYHPVLFMEPADAENRTVVGFDLSTDPIVRVAMDRARDTAQPVASGILHGVPLLGERMRGFALAIPVYPFQAELESVEARRRALVGFVFSVFSSEDLLRQDIQEPGMSGEVYDAATADPASRFNPSEPAGHPNGLHSAELVQVAGRDWLIAVRSATPRVSSVTFNREVLLGGLLLSLLLFMVSRAQRRELETATRHETELQALARHDALTTLPNRVLFSEHLGKSIAAARRNDSHVAVLFIDLDRFKHINDSMGHAVGDDLLRSVAARLRTCVRESDTVSRLGGDEFVVLLSEIAHADHAAARAQQMIAAISAPHEVTGHTIHVTLSVGISLYPADGADAPALLQAADTAMYQAKEGGRNKYQFFESAMNARAVARQRIEAGLRRALDHNEFVLHYQPRVSLATGTVTGVEALVRWASPDRGLVEPTEFVTIAEDCGLILPIGRHVLRQACTQARAWLDAGTPLTVSVNVSALELREKDFLGHVQDVLAETRLEPRYLELELTESGVMHNADSSIALLRSLKDFGLTIALDDFGTGYSSLSYLRRLPIDVMKIDQSFVREIATEMDESPLVSAMVSVGTGLHCRVVAEGVETPAQAAFLTRVGCGEGQGFYFGRPVAAELLDPLRR
jgi:diguanylate cyclase (GGDEF)-like protein